MRQPVLFDEKLIERNLEFYKKKFTRLSRERRSWLEDHADLPFRVDCLNIPFKLVPTNLLYLHGPPRVEEAVANVENHYSFLLYRYKDRETFIAIREMHAFIDNDIGIYYQNIERAMLCGAPEGPGAVVFLSKSRNINYTHQGLISNAGQLSTRQHHKLNPDEASCRFVSIGASAKQILDQMNRLLIWSSYSSYGKTDELWLSAIFSNEFVAKMAEQFVSAPKA